MSNTMKAVILTSFGGRDAFVIQTLPIRSVGPRQVRVRVHLMAINPLDYQIRRGDYADYVPLPTGIGHDVSGVVETVGADVTEFALGDEVYYTPKIFGGAGSYAEVHVADVDLVARKPRNLSHVEAASLTLVGGTVWEAFVSRAGLCVGETVLIHGGAGRVGTIAIQIAKAIGARVITLARASNHDFVNALGADDVLLHRLRRRRRRAHRRTRSRRRLRHDRRRHSDKESVAGRSDTGLRPDGSEPSQRQALCGTGRVPR